MSCTEGDLVRPVSSLVKGRQGLGHLGVEVAREGASQQPRGPKVTWPQEEPLPRAQGRR